ncbi:unnamed protein product [Cylindrotheca closterium]|uniref:Uncharacterized protein n=1 Tax=Cylindrotheca closterium TaxID=2856 RepID=A0AAD2CMX5_9STRA|nr:unnamed protein product [Cylindrotheca closterium]
MKTKLYVEKAVHQWRTMFSCGEDTTLDAAAPKKNNDDQHDPINKSKGQSSKSKDTSLFRQMTSKIMVYGDIERINTDSTTTDSSQSEKHGPHQAPVIDTIRPDTKTVPIAIETTDNNSIASEKRTKTNRKKQKKNRLLRRNPVREQFFETVVYDLGYDELEDESEQDKPITSTTKTQQDKTKENEITEPHKDYGPSSSTKHTPSQEDTYSVSVLTMREFDADGNFAPDVVRKEHNYNSSQKMAQMMKGIDIKSSIARMRMYKQGHAAEQQQRLQYDEMRREQEELLQKRLQQRRRENERKEHEEKLQKQLELQKKRDEEANKKKSVTGGVDKWEDEYSVDDNEDSLNYSVSVMTSNKTSGILKSSGHLAPPSRFVIDITTTTKEEAENSRGPLFGLFQIGESQIEDGLSDEEDAPSDEDDEEYEPKLISRPKAKPFAFTFGKEEELESSSSTKWESFEGGHVFHMGLGKKHFTKRGHFKTSGFKWEERPWEVVL